MLPKRIIRIIRIVGPDDISIMEAIAEAAYEPYVERMVVEDGFDRVYMEKKISP